MFEKNVLKLKNYEILRKFELFSISGNLLFAPFFGKSSPLNEKVATLHPLDMNIASAN